MDPDERMIKFNESRRNVIEETPGLYNTVGGHQIGHWELHVDQGSPAREQLPKFDQGYDRLYWEANSTQGPGETQAHRFM